MGVRDKFQHRLEAAQARSLSSQHKQVEIRANALSKADAIGRVQVLGANLMETEGEDAGDGDSGDAGDGDGDAGLSLALTLAPRWMRAVTLITSPDAAQDRSGASYGYRRSEGG